VPAGPVVIEVFYTGLAPRIIPLQLRAGDTLVQDVNLATAALLGQNIDTVKLDAFVVATSKELEGAALATNEQRFSPNLKNVVVTDTFGDVQEGTF